jgi:hypothetical protein
VADGFTEGESGWVGPHAATMAGSSGSPTTDGRSETVDFWVTFDCLIPGVGPTAEQRGDPPLERRDATDLQDFGLGEGCVGCEVGVFAATRFRSVPVREIGGRRLGARTSFAGEDAHRRSFVTDVVGVTGLLRAGVEASSKSRKQTKAH